MRKIVDGINPGHRLLGDVALQLSVEWNRRDLKLLYDAIEKLRINFYEDTMELDDIAASVDDTKRLLKGVVKKIIWW